MACESDKDRKHTPIASTPHPPPPPEGTITVSLTPDRADTVHLRNQLIEIIEQAGYDEAAVFAIRLAYEEAINNAVKYGSRSPDSQIKVDYHITPKKVYLRITDQGPGFDPSTIPDPTHDNHIATPAGRGLFLIRAYMSQVTFNEKGNSITLVYRNRTSN